MLAVGETRDGTLYIAMELLAGESLRSDAVRWAALAIGCLTAIVTTALL